MGKVCVFCGKKPEGKNREHIIPQWLIKYTGEPGRNFYLGTVWLTESCTRNYSADQFQFPACRKCNDKYSDLETSASKIIYKIFDGAMLSTEQIDILLDWFDKVRVGLWVGYRYLEKDYFGIDPHFYIDSRMGRADRVLFVYCLSDSLRGLSFNGITSPVFFHMPSCFFLRIKSLLFVNMSMEFLLSRRVGFPYPKKVVSSESGTVVTQMNEPLKRIIKPIIKCAFKEPEYAFFQPILPSVRDIDAYRKFGNDYLERHMLYGDKGKGEIVLIVKGGYCRWLSKGDEVKIESGSSSISDAKSFDIMKVLTVQVHDFQLKLLEQKDSIMGLELLPDRERKDVKQKFRFISKMQKLITANTRKAGSRTLFKSQKD